MKLLLLSWLAVVGGDVHLGDGSVLSGGTVLINKKNIVEVGLKVKIPEGAHRIDARGKIVTPGLIESQTRLGLVEIGGVAGSNDVDSGTPGPIRAAHRAVDSLNPDSSLLPIQRQHGLTTVLSAPGGGLISGQAAVISLDGALVNRRVAMMTGWGGSGRGSRGASIGLLREVLDDARVFMQHPYRFEENRMRKLAASRLDLSALRPVLKGEIPLMIRVNRRSDIRTAIALGKEFKIRIVIVGGREAWLEAELLAQERVPVIIDPSANLPGSFDALRTRHDAIVILVRAGVQVAISTFSTHNARKLRQWAGNAVRSGLSPAAALSAITSNPAAILDLRKRGSLKGGYVADLVVWSGDPFELSSQAEQVIIGGRVMPAKHRQHALFERYRRVGEDPRLQ